MNRKLPYDKGLLLIVLSLVGLGLIMVFSASTVISKDLYKSHTAIFFRQSLYALVGLIAMIVAMRIDYHRYFNRRLVCAVVGATAFLLALVLILPEASKGAQRWVRLGPIHFQPSELAKLAMVLFTAYYLVAKKEEFPSLTKGVLPYLAVLGTILGLILIEPDLGTAASIALASAFILFVAGLRYRYIVGLFLIVVPVVYLAIVRVPYRLKRVTAFLDPLQDPLGTGYQIRQSLIAVGSGGVAGVGYAEGKQKLFFLPEPHTDFIFSVVGEELGLIGALVLIVLFGLFFRRGVRIALRADTPFGTYLGLGIVGMVVIQAFINMGVAVSLLPTKGIPLPFISAGGSSMLVMLAAAGILLNISQHSSRAETVRERSPLPVRRPLANARGAESSSAGTEHDA